MLKIEILSIGKDKDSWVTDACGHFVKQLKRHAAVKLTALPALKAKASLSPIEIKRREAERFEKAIGSGYVIALTDRGKEYDSRAFASFLERLRAESRGAVTFLIGGPYGLADSLLERADACVSLSPLTFSHQLVRLILLEQLFRGFDILAGGSYHK